mgnify:CR=1 FL=1
MILFILKIRYAIIKPIITVSTDNRNVLTVGNSVHNGDAYTKPREASRTAEDEETFEIGKDTIVRLGKSLDQLHVVGHGVQVLAGQCIDGRRGRLAGGVGEVHAEPGREDRPEQRAVVGEIENRAEPGGEATLFIYASGDLDGASKTYVELCQAYVRGACLAEARLCVSGKGACARERPYQARAWRRR